LSARNLRRKDVKKIRAGTEQEYLSLVETSELEFLKSLWGLGTEEEEVNVPARQAK
jgi:hypothetical protein